MEEIDEVPRTDTILTDIQSFFSGESDSAREQIARLNEASLRSLRDQLHSQLVEVIPAIAGRPLMKRMPGNVAKLADDCWAFGSSLAQSVLLKEADNVLKPPDRRIPASVLRSSSATRITSAGNEKMETILNNMVRMDREIQCLQVSETKLREIIKAQQVRIASLEERLAGFVIRGENPSDSVATPLRSALASARAERTPLQYAGASTGPAAEDALVSRIDTNGPDVNLPLVHDASADVAATDAPDATSQTVSPTMTIKQSGNAMPSGATVHGPADTSVAITSAGGNPATASDQVATSSPSASAPVTEVRQSEEPAGHPAVGLAAEVARALDIDRLAIAIVAQMKRRTGPSPGTDCEGSDSSDYEPIAYPRVTRPPRVNRSQSEALPPPAGTIPDRSNAQPNLDRRDAGLTAVIGTDVRAMSLSTASAPATFVLEGVHPDIPDSTAHSVVSNIVCKLSGFKKVHNGDKASGKSFTFITDGGEDSVIMNPANWPIGLRVRKMEGRDQHFQETSIKQPFQASRRDQQERRPRGQRQQQQRRKQRRQDQRQPQFVEQEDRNELRRPWQKPDTRQQEGVLEQSRQGQHQEQVARQHTQSHWMGQPLPQPLWRQQPIQPTRLQQPDHDHQDHQRQQLYAHQQQLQPQWPTQPQVWQTGQPPPQQQQDLPPPQQPSPLAAQQLQQQQLLHQAGGESLWHGQERIQAGPFRPDSWPVLPSCQQFDRPTVTTSGAATIQVPAAVHGNGHRFSQ